MAAAQSVDDVLVCLMSMGFDYQDCQDAIQCGKVTVEMAVEWLLAGKPGSGEQAKLTLRGDASQFEEGTNPFSNPGPQPTFPSDMDTGETSSAQLDDNTVLSRLHLSDEQRKVKQRFEQKQIDEARQEALKDKQRRKRDHARILKEIQEDREKQKLFHHSPHAEQTTTGENEGQATKGGITSPATSQGSSQKPTTESGSSKSDAAPGGAPAKSDSTQTKATNSPPTKCLIQIRLPDGRVVRQSFQASTTMAELRDYIQENLANLYGMSIIQPFPHREFGDKDMTQRLDELGLAPSGSLVVRNKEKSQSFTNAANNATASGLRSKQKHGPSVGMDAGTAGSSAAQSLFGSGGPFGFGAAPGLQGQPNFVTDGSSSGPSWGKGYKMTNDRPGQEQRGDQEMVNEGEAAINNAEEMNADSDDDIGPAHAGQFAQGHGDMADIFDDPIQLGHAMNQPGQYGYAGGHGGGGLMFQGVGQRLVPEGHPHFEENLHHNRPARELAAEKARERFAHPPIQVDKEQEKAPTSVSYSVQKLLAQCLQHVTRRLKDPQDHLHTLGGISEDLAQKVLDYLLKNKLLTPKLLQAFVPCYLRKLVLDCYPLTSNDMLNSVRQHHQLVHLSLRSCPLITDAGLKPLIVLKKLKYLSLSGCKQITDRSFDMIKELKSLNALLLEGTGISNTGLEEFINADPPPLHHLNLNSTQVTEAIIPHLTGLQQLKSLYLEHTQVGGLSGIQDLKTLETLDIAHTSIVTDSLLCLHDNKSLTCLGISHTSKVNGDLALQYIAGLSLQAVNLPSRHSTTDKGMPHIINFHLTALDLTNYIYVGDEGIQQIAKIRSLKKLLLSNTKITDEGMLYLEGLKLLEVLYLDRTNVTDEGVSVIKEFPALRELGLSATNVTSKFLKQKTLDGCRNLTKLNLSRTGVTDTGVRRLHLPCLVLLNLDGTPVHPNVTEFLALSCPELKSVTLTNLLPAVSDDELED